LFVITLVALSTACARTDADVRASVETKLAVDQATAPAKIDVSVTGGVVHLAGETSTREQQRQAVELAKSVRGVKDVESGLRLSDEVVEQAVKQKLAADSVVGSIPIAVEAHEGVVKLESNQTNKDERQRIVQLTSSVDGVTKVEDWMK